MLRRFDELDSGPEFSITSREFTDAKSNTQLISKLNDSFDSSFVPVGSEISCNSQNSFCDESDFSKPKNSTLEMPRTTKNSIPFRQASVPRPVSVLKTTFLPDDTVNYDLPKILVPNERPKLPKKKVEKGLQSLEPSKSVKEFEKVNEIKTQLLKKDALIETLRNRVAKMVEELEETHRKLKISKAGNETKELQGKFEELDRKVQGFQVKERELQGIIDKKEKEIVNLNGELRTIKVENEENKSRVFRTETEVLRLKQKCEQLEGANSTLQSRMDHANKSLELSGLHSSQLETEIHRLETTKRTQEHELKIQLEEKSLSLQTLNKKIQESQENCKTLQKLLKDSEERFENLSKSHTILNFKLQSLESQLSNINQSIRIPLQERRESTSYTNISETPKILERQFTFNGENFDTRPGHKKSHSINSCSKSILKEIMQTLELKNTYEILPSIKKLTLAHTEKKLVKKLTAFVKECVFKDITKEVTPGQVWRLIKKVFEDYASIVKHLHTSELSQIRQCLGEGNWAEKITTLNQEHKILRDLLNKLRQKLKLPIAATVSEIESAINSIRLS